MQCPNCGAENRAIARFCQHCGAVLAPAVAEESEAAAGEGQAAVERRAATTEQVEAEEEIAAEERAVAEEEVATAEGLAVTEQVAAAEELAAEEELAVEGQVVAQEEATGEQAAIEGPAATEEQPIAQEQPATGQAVITEQALSEEQFAVPEPIVCEDQAVIEGQAATTEQAAEVQAVAERHAEGTEQAGAEEAAPEVQPAGPVAGATATEVTVPVEQLETEAADVAGTVRRVGDEVEADMPGQDAGPESASEGQPAGEAGVTEGAPEASATPSTGEAPLQPAEVPVVEASPAQAPEEAAAVETELREADMLPWREEPAQPAPLKPGELIDGRYRIVELLSIDQAGVLYTARDLRRCPQCGYDQNSPDQAFCTACGAVLDQKPLVRVLQHPAGQQPPSDVEVLDHVAEGERTYWVWKELGKQTDVLGGSEEPMRLEVGQRTHPGQTRELDEDSLFTLTLTRTFESMESASALFVVADGMGGHEAGEVASRIAIRALADAVLRDVFARELAGAELDDEAIRAAFEHAVQVANEQVFLERERRENDMGTTVTAALLRDWTLFIAHVGDCRAYRWGNDGLQQLTTDHSVIASMVASGAAQPEEVYTHPHRSVIYRSVGDQPSVEVDTAVLSVEPGDRLVLCCDGLWEMLRDDGIEEVLLREADPQRACDAMVEQANEAGGPDNISVIVVQL